MSRAVAFGSFRYRCDHNAGRAAAILEPIFVWRRLPHYPSLILDHGSPITSGTNRGCPSCVALPALEGEVCSDIVLNTVSASPAVQVGKYCYHMDLVPNISRSSNGDAESDRQTRFQR